MAADELRLSLASVDGGGDEEKPRGSSLSSISSSFSALDRERKAGSPSGSEDLTLLRGQYDSSSDFTLPEAISAFNLIFGRTHADDALKILRSDDLSVPGPIHVHAENKGLMPRHFSNTRLAQVIQAHDGAIYTLKFSPDGKYLATGGEDARVVVWIVGQLPAPIEESIDSPTPSVVSDVGGGEATAEHGGGGGGGGGSDKEPSLSSSDRDESEAALPDRVDRDVIVYPSPFREYVGHTESVLDVAWSGSNFLLSASADKFVRLWRLEDESRCLKLFGHTDIVTSVDFHPSNDTHFISACYNGQVRLWDNIRSNSLDYAVAPLADGSNFSVPFTSVSFVPDGSRFFAGLKDGQILIYAYKVESADKVKISRETSLDWLRDRKGKYSNGRKVTGICFDASKGADPKLLRWCVTSNDSNVRLVESIVPPFKYACKYKGGKNTSLQIKASFSQGGSFLICPTENGTALIWEPDDDSASLLCDSVFGIRRPETRRNSTYEWFNCTSSSNSAVGPEGKGGKTNRTPATAAVFAPAGSVTRLLESAVEIKRRGGARRHSPDASASSAGRRDPPTAIAEDPAASTPHSMRSTFSHGAALPDEAQLSSLIIATADGEGKLRLFVRSPT